MSIDFREIDRRLCIIKDTVMPKLLCSESSVDANAVICYGYIDKISGITFEVLCLASYVDGDYTIVNENKSVNAKIRAEKFQNSEIIPIKNAAIMKRFEKRINLIDEVYYENDSVEKMRNFSVLDKFRHPFYPDDIQALLLKEGLKPESIWVRLKKYTNDTEHDMTYYEGDLLNSPFDSRYNLTEGESVFLVVSDKYASEVCFVILKQNHGL